MRSKNNLRPVQVAVGAMMLLTGGSAVALAAGQANAQSAIQVHLDTRHVAFGGRVKMSGHADAANAGQPVQLQYAPVSPASWRSIGTSRIRRDGSFVVTGTVRRSGSLRVAAGAAGAPRSGASGSATPAVAPSPSETVSVAARFRVDRNSRNILGDHSAPVRGKLLPEVRGRKVTLLGRVGRSWRQLAATRTGAHGGFVFKVRPGGPPRQRLLVRFAGDQTNTRAWSYAGRVTTFHPSVASQYDDGGATACGFHANFGVANRALPCGTNVTISYGGRSVTAVVDDRGPFVGGRDWDLNQNTAGALGFSGVDTVWTSL